MILPPGPWLPDAARRPGLACLLAALLGLPACPAPVTDGTATPSASAATEPVSGVTLREATDATCGDDVDNDGDGNTDCEDRGCVYTASVTVCGHRPSDEADDAGCGDGVDNDGDAFIDCDDNDCKWNGDVGVCDRDSDGYTPHQGDCFDHPNLDLAVAVSPVVPEMCGDGEDNDCDGAAEEAACIQLDLGLRAVTYFSDGDTFDVDGLGPVRLKGIDTPETHGEDGVECYGPEAAARTQGLIGDAQVRIVLDPVDYADGFRDLYDRLLAHTYTADGLYINGSLVEDGYACVWASFACSRKVELLELEDAAQAADAGLWGTCGGSVCF